jgi:hypothetical protein
MIHIYMIHIYMIHVDLKTNDIYIYIFICLYMYRVYIHVQVDFPVDPMIFPPSFPGCGVCKVVLRYT